MEQSGVWYNVKIRVKQPCDYARWVPVVVLVYDDGEKEVTYIEQVELNQYRDAPEWGNFMSELAWLDKWSMPHWTKQVDAQIAVNQ
jgi:hypothetical protein